MVSEADLRDPLPRALRTLILPVGTQAYGAYRLARAAPPGAAGAGACGPDEKFELSPDTRSY
jgi:hypothetical protein